MKMRNPVQGVRGHRLRSTCPAWGVSSLVTGRTGVDLLRGLLANPVAANSSTTKGPRGLAGESCERRSRIVKDLGRWVRGCFYVRSPEMRAVLLSTRPRNYAGSGELDIRPTSLPVTRDSNVSREMKGMTNAGSSAAAGLVPGAWNESRPGESKRSVQRRKSDQWKRTIRNRAVARIRWRSDRPNAVEWECGLSRKLSCHLAGAGLRTQAMFPARQWGLVDVVTGGADGNVTTKGLTGSM